MSESTLRYIEVFSQLAASIATFAAPSVAIYFSRRDFIPRLGLAVAYREIWELGRGKIADVITISLTNLGHRPINVLSLYWTIGVNSRLMPKQLRQKIGYQTTEITKLSAVSLPVLLQEGEIQQIVIEEDQNRKWFAKDMARFVSQVPGWIRGTLRLNAVLSTGHMFKCKPDALFMAEVQKGVLERGGE